MTRCIHCTRCVRFLTEVAGVPELGAIGRGEHMEISTYVEKVVSSELSGNLVDLCPVGALTNKAYSFVARPWELRKTESIDVFDALGSNIRIDSRGNEVLRILPRLNEEINEEWLGDKGRYCVDALKRQRLDVPYVRENGRLCPTTWEKAFKAIAQAVGKTSGDRMAAIAGDMADAESMILLKDLMTGLGSRNIDCRQDGAAFEVSNRLSWLFNSGISGIDEADVILIVGSNPRHEAPVLNARLRRRYLSGGVTIGLIGEREDTTFRYDHLGVGPETLAEVASGRHRFAGLLRSARKPMVILGMGALARPDGKAILHVVSKMVEEFGLLKDDWNGFNVLHTAAGRVAGLEMGFVPGPNGRGVAEILEGAEKGEIDFVYLLGADEIEVSRVQKAFIVYQGSHGDAGASYADVILPGAAYTEKSGTYVNMAGVMQRTQRAVFPPGGAREDWTIIRALSEALGRRPAQDTLAQVRDRLASCNPVFDEDGVLPEGRWGVFGEDGDFGAECFVSPIRNYYMTDPISRASSVMAVCTEVFSTGVKRKAGTGTHG